jgi:hypothetical protein
MDPFAFDRPLKLPRTWGRRLSIRPGAWALATPTHRSRRAIAVW